MLGIARRSYVSVIVLCFAIAAASSAKSAAELLVSPIILGKIESGADVMSLLCAILAFTAILFVLSALQNYFTNNALPGRIGVRLKIVEKISEKLANTSYPNTLDTRFMEAFAKSSYATAGNNRATEAFWTTFTTIITYAICFVVYLFLISGLNVLMALFVLVLSVAGYFVNKRINEWGYRHRDEGSDIYKRLSYIENLSTDREYAKDIRIFGLKNQIDRVWKSTIRTYRAFVMKREKTYILANVTDTLIMLLRSGAAYAYLIHAALEGNLTVSAFLLYFGAVSGFAEWVTGLLGQFSELHKQSLDISSVREFIEWEEQFKFDEGETLIPQKKPYEIKLENVSLKYAGAEKDTLSGINLTVHPGEKLAVVGLNGAGKTTLVKLICGFLDPTEGRVLLDGEDIRKYNRRDYYKMFSAVFQDFSLLEATVAENVAQRTDDIDIEKMKKCVDEAGLKEKIESLPAGYETHLGKRVFDDGVELSGGQTQRLMLARALYKDAPVLLLDEPTAALDPIAENEIYMKYNEMTSGRTSIFISHRLASTRFCDRILFIADGHIAEEGTHEELLARGGRYAELFEVQSKYYREEGQKMKKNKKEERDEATFAETIGRDLRVLKMFLRICPQKLVCSFFYSLVTALTPYVTVVFSARLVSDLEIGRDAKTYITDVALILSVTAALMLLGAVLKHLNTAYDDASFFESQKPVMDKIAGMDFEDADSERVYDLFMTARQTQNFQGYGMYNTLSLSEEVLKSVFGIAGGVGLTVTLFTSHVTDSAYKFLDSPIFALLVVGVMLGVSLLSAFFTNKVNDLFVKCNTSGRFGNRCYGFFGFMVKDLSRAPDIRIYDQQKNVCVPNIKKYNMFCPGSDFAKLTKGPMGFYSALSVGISVIVTGVIYLFVCLKSRAGAFGLGYVTQYIGAATALFVGIGDLMRNLTELRANGEFLEPIFDLLGTENKMKSGSLLPSGEEHIIEFRDVSFKYPSSDTFSLRHVSIKIEAGKKIAVVGLNGSGKTTFIKLLCRLYDPTEGEILLDGRDIREYDYGEYMNIFSIVFQDFKLFAFPIDENVSAGKDADNVCVRDCLVKAGFGDRLASLKNGVKTYLYNDIDKDGIRVSGGEAQKIAIARALYKDAPIIVLDEPTAALDPIAEAEIYSKFNEIVGDGTAIYISHRLSSCRFCDEIAVFDGGSIVEYGDHETLLESGGKYSELWGAQAQYYAEEDK